MHLCHFNLTSLTRNWQPSMSNSHKRTNKHAHIEYTRIDVEKKQYVKLYHELQMN